jgi:hypothetical protein
VIKNDGRNCGKWGRWPFVDLKPGLEQLQLFGLAGKKVPLFPLAVRHPQRQLSGCFKNFSVPEPINP